MALKLSRVGDGWVRRAAAPAVLAAVIALVAACAGGPVSESASNAVAAPATTTQPAADSTPAAGSASAIESKTAVQPAGPTSYFVDAQGTRVPAEGTVTLPTGAPPSGRIFPRSDDGAAVIYVTVDGTIPTEYNNWTVFKSAETGRYISSLEAKPRTYRIVAVDPAKGSGPVSTYLVNWTDEKNPKLDAPSFEANGNRIAPGGEVTLPTGGESNPAGRLSVTCNYLGATLYITNDGSQPSPKNFWKSEICDGTYIFASNGFTASYKAMAVLRGSQSQVTEVKVTWKAQ